MDDLELWTNLMYVFTILGDYTESN